MPRSERKKSATGIYHILLRGITGQHIFEEEADYFEFLDCLRKVKELSRFSLYAYCLMDNHVHLLMEEGEEPLSTIMRRFGARYVFRFNWKYKRNGHLFQDRYKSECVESDAYFLTVLKYIYQNPVKAGLCRHPVDYRWSSRHRAARDNGLIDEVKLARLVAIKEVEKWEKEPVHAELLENRIGRKRRYTDEEAAILLTNCCRAEGATAFQQLSQERQQTVIREMRAQSVPIRQVARVTGLSKGIIERWDKKLRDA
jgi:REP element-mobilizing transposase RayT